MLRASWAVVLASVLPLPPFRVSEIWALAERQGDTAEMIRLYEVTGPASCSCPNRRIGRCAAPVIGRSVPGSSPAGRPGQPDHPRIVHPQPRAEARRGCGGVPRRDEPPARLYALSPNADSPCWVPARRSRRPDELERFVVSDIEVGDSSSACDEFGLDAVADLPQTLLEDSNLAGDFVIHAPPSVRGRATTTLTAPAPSSSRSFSAASVT